MGVENSFSHHERGVVLFVDSAEDEAAAMDVDQDRELGSGVELEESVRDVELEDQTVEFVRWWDFCVTGEGAAGCVAGWEGLRAGEAGGVSKEPMERNCIYCIIMLGVDVVGLRRLV